MNTCKALIEHFRCLEEHFDFKVISNGASPEGFFQFGPSAVCYGHVGVGFAAADVRAELHDSASDVSLEDGAWLLPFDPDAIVENLRRERYVPDNSAGGAGAMANGFVRKAYYAVRPLLPVAVRKHLQRHSLKGWESTPFPSWPVDRSVDKIFEKLMMLALESRGLEKIPFIWFWPEGKSGCAIMTHDVETKTGLDFCPALMDLNDSHGIKSSFQIIPGARYHATPQDLDRMRSRGFEVNIHDWNHDGHLYSSREVFLERAAKINQAAKQFQAEGFRAGVLYRNTDWYDKYTFSYDMSMPNVGHLDPQPGGCCTVMPYFIGRILEIPLTTIQDYPLFNILRRFSTDLWKQQIELILEGNGLISSIVHPDYVIDKQARGVYDQLLAHLAKLGSERNVWLALPRDVNHWWRDRSEMTLVERNGRWEIEGPGKERARVAYASSDGNRLVYSFAE